MFLPGESHGQWSPEGHKESDMTERLSTFICLWCTGYSLVAVNRLLIAVASFVAEHGL